MNQFVKAGLLSLSLVLLFFIAWEFFWRSKGYGITYDDGKDLWSGKRALIYQPKEEATVFIGSSRIKYDLDIPTWERLTGEQAVQLAMEGNSPVPILVDLSNDRKFKGKLVVDVTEGLFFSASPNNTSEPEAWIHYYKDKTPSQKGSYFINKGLESQLAFLNKEYLSINGLLGQLEIPKREGVFHFPYFPKEFGHVTFERQSIIEEKFMYDTNLQKQVTGNWMFFAEMRKKSPPQPPTVTDSIFQVVKAATEKIIKRGGEVIFVRTPSSGPYWEGEKRTFPREKYWDRLLTLTGIEGIHFKDYPETSNYICPEWSHLGYKDAIDYTQHFVDQLVAKGWRFKQPSTNNVVVHTKN